MTLLYPRNSTGYGGDPAGFAAPQIGVCAHDRKAALGAVGAAGGAGCGAGQVAIRGRGTNAGLINAYRTSARATNRGRGSFQVIRVPQYNKASLAGTVTAYRGRIALALGGSYWLAEFDRFGNREMHGPFRLGQAFGHSPTAQAIDWQAIRSKNQAVAESPRGKRGQGATGARLWVGERGFQQVTYVDLLAAGVDLAGVPNDEIALLRGGQAVARRIVAGGDTFGPGARIEFFGEPRASLYGLEAAYSVERLAGLVLTIADDDRPPGPSRPAYAWATGRYAPQNAYNFAAPTADPWYADRLLAFAGTPVGHSVEIAWSARALVDQVASVHAELAGVTDWPGPGQDHQVRLLINGQNRAQVEADGVSLIELGADIALGAVDGLLPLRVEATGATGFDFDVVNLEAIELRYPRLAVAEGGRWFGEDVQFGAVANDPIQDPPGAAAGLLGDGFEEELAVRATTSLRVRNLDSAELVAYARSQGIWRYLSDTRMLPAGAGFDAFVPTIGRGDDVYVAGVAALARPRVEALPTRTDIQSGPADYLVISHGLFVDRLGALLARRQAQGLRIAVVEVGQIYQQFGNGDPDPEAIAAYIRFAAAVRGTRYVLLVGGDSYDYHDYLHSGSQSFIPTLYRQTNNVVHFAPLDAAFGDVNQDGLSEIAVGRLPVRSADELELLVGKILAAEAPVGGRSVVLATGASDAANSFPAMSDMFAARLPGSWTLSHADVDSLGVAGTRSALLAGWAARPALISYVGHSAPGQWTFDPLFTASELAALAGTESVPAVLQWGCWNTYFVSPSADSLGQALLLQGNQGAAAVFGSAALTDIANHSALGPEFYAGLAAGRRIGDALLDARKALAAVGRRSVESQQGGNLLGDPAMILR